MRRARPNGVDGGSGTKDEKAMQYYFLDWVAMGTSLLAVYLLGQKNRLGFASFMVSNTLWMAVGFLAGSYGILLGNVVFFGLNLRGFLKWKPAEPEAATEVDPVAIRPAQRCP